MFIKFDLMRYVCLYVGNTGKLNRMYVCFLICGLVVVVCNIVKRHYIYASNLVLWEYDDIGIRETPKSVFA